MHPHRAGDKHDRARLDTCLTAAIDRPSVVRTCEAFGLLPRGAHKLAGLFSPPLSTFTPTCKYKWRRTKGILSARTPCR